MDKRPVIAVFDVGKTNKKLFLIDEDFSIVAEYSQKMEEITDDEGFPCDDLSKIRQLLPAFLKQVLQLSDYALKAVNVSAYGASFVYVDEKGEPVFPLYNYLKPYAPLLQKQFYAAYGGEGAFSLSAASPVLGSLNSGMQLYRLKYEKPGQFASVKYALHLPQYLSFLISGVAASDLTSIGCHTNMWHFRQAAYQPWLKEEGLLEKLPPIMASTKAHACIVDETNLYCGVGLHDSSAALVPYLVSAKEPFLLLSTGTWCIALNPFNQSPLTENQLAQDCLCYLSYEGEPVKAARLFAGHFHEQETNRIASHFGLDANFYQSIPFNEELLAKLAGLFAPLTQQELENLSASPFSKRNLQAFESAAEAYYQLVVDMVAQQKHSIQLVLDGSTHVKMLFVDGGFSNNKLFMRLLARAFPQLEVYASQVAQASAIGAALAIHEYWNTKPIPRDLLKLTAYHDQ